MSQASSRISSLGTVGAFLNGRACSDTLLHVLNRAFDHPLKDEERALMPMAGGIVQHGYQCGMIWGAALAAGAEAYRRLGNGPQAEAMAIVAAQRVVESFRGLAKNINCLEITELDKSASAMQLFAFFALKGGAFGCIRMAARFAPLALREIETALAETPVETPPAPVSCAAELARKMGASDLHAVMAAGLAGGIGLSGGACGALGAAIWIMGMRSLNQGAAKLDFKAPEAIELIERFLKCTDYEFECSTIAGRQFERVGDHAEYVCNGGCSKLIEVLAAGGVEIEEEA